MSRLLFIFIGLILLSLAACRPDPDLDAKMGPSYEFIVPTGWPAPHYNFEANKLTKDGFELGRKIFYDPRLSRNSTVSCGSCHQQFAAFAQLDHPVSHGVDNALGTRNSPALFNINWHTSFFWDGGVNHIEVFPLNPIQNPVEMDETVQNITDKLSADAQYKTMFRLAFGSEEVTTQRIFKALAQFMGLMVSSNSKYDKWMRGEGGTVLSPAEMDGLKVFQNNCASCHKEPLFTDYSYRNNGLKPSSLNDSGRMMITMDPGDMYRFKVPSLRNLRYSRPYMHDGRLETLEAVLNHYATGIEHTATLDPALQNGIPLTNKEQADLLQFLNTLNDEEFIKDTRFAEVK